MQLELRTRIRLAKQRLNFFIFRGVHAASCGVLCASCGLLRFSAMTSVTACFTQHSACHAVPMRVCSACVRAGLVQSWPGFRVGRVLRQVRGPRLSQTPVLHQRPARLRGPGHDDWPDLDALQLCFLRLAHTRQQVSMHPNEWMVEWPDLVFLNSF